MTTPAEIQAILNGPALAPPFGIIPQIGDPTRINITCLSITGAFLFLAILSFSMRIYTKWIILRNVVREDYCLILGMIFLIIYTGLAFQTAFLGAGTHQWNIKVKTMKSVLFYIYNTEIVYGFSVCFIRASILFQYLRIFFPIRRTTFMYIGCWTTLWLNVVFYTIITFCTIFACTPRAKYWDPLITGQCLDSGKINLATGIFNIITDFVLVLLPQYEIWKLHTSRRRKIGVAGIFLVALCGCVTSIMRLYYSIELKHTNDVSYYVVYLGTTGMAEISIGVLCCSMLVSPKFFQVVIKNSSLWTKSKSKLAIISNNVPKRSTALRKSDVEPRDLHNQVRGPYSALDDSTELKNLDLESDAALSNGVISEPDSVAMGTGVIPHIMVEDSLV